MRVLLVIIISSIISYQGFCQETEASKKPVSFGFNLGMNVPHTKVEFNYLDPAETKVSNIFGFSLGLLMNYPLNQTFCLSPRAEIGFYNLPIEVIENNSDVTEYAVFPAAFELKPHVKVKHPTLSKLPYFLIGPEIRIPLKSDENKVLPINPDFTIEIGIGYENKFNYFSFAPELHYSYGFQNILADNEISSISDYRFHVLSLIFNFY